MAGLHSDADVSGLIVSRKDASGNVMEGTFEGTPPTTANKFAVGCKIQDKTNGILYVNDGTLASPTWEDQNATSTGDLADLSVTTAKIALDAIDGTLIGDDVIDSEHYVAASIDNEHLADNAVDTEELAADAVDSTKIADDAVDSEHIAAGAVDLEHMASQSVDEDNVVDGAGVGALLVKKTAMVVYDFAADGGTIGAIVLADSATLPDNAVIVDINYDVITTCTTASADAGTLKLILPTDGDLSTAIAVSDGTNPFDVGAHFGSVITILANKTTGARAIGVEIATQNFTAGKIIFFVDYMITL